MTDAVELANSSGVPCGPLQVLRDALLCSERFSTSDGELLTATVLQAALAHSEELVDFLAEDPDARKMFFRTTGTGVVIFEAQTIVDTLSTSTFFKGCPTSFANKIALGAGGRLHGTNSPVVLHWPYREAVVAAGMKKEDEGSREEHLLHPVVDRGDIDQLFAPKAFRSATRYSVEDGGVQQVQANELRPDDNLIIHGNNLLALHTIAARFSGQVRLIYIDPPYRTGRDDFGYNDRFNHSTWLTFMRNRLEAAKKLLRPDGAIAVQCDWHEDGYLRVLMDEIFGPDRFVNRIVVKTANANGTKVTHTSRTILKLTDTILVYKAGTGLTVEQPAKTPKTEWDDEYNLLLDGLTKTARREIAALQDKESPDAQDLTSLRKILADVSVVPFDQSTHIVAVDDVVPTIHEWTRDNAWRLVRFNGSDVTAGFVNDATQDVGDGVLDAYLTDGRLTIVNAAKVRELRASSKQATKGMRLEMVFYDNNLDEYLGDLWTDISVAGGAREGGVELPGGKKPEKLLQRLITMFTRPGDLVLDYHLGSGTTAAVAHKLGRRYIGIEQLDYGNNSETARLSNVLLGDPTGISKSVGWQGGGSFVRAEVVPVVEALASQIADATADLDALFEAVQMDGWLTWRLAEDLRAGWHEWSADEKRGALHGALDWNNAFLTLSDAADPRWGLSDDDIAFSRSVQTPVPAQDSLLGTEDPA